MTIVLCTANAGFSERLKDLDSTGLLQVDRTGIMWRAFAAPSRGRSSHSVEVTIHLRRNHPFCLIVHLTCTPTLNRLITQEKASVLWEGEFQVGDYMLDCKSTRLEKEI